MNRVFTYDTLSQNNAIWNAQKSLEGYLTLTVQPDWTVANVSTNAYTFLNRVYPLHFWFVYAYPNVVGQDLHSWACTSCFAALDVSNSYHVLVSGVPRSSVANTALV